MLEAPASSATTSQHQAPPFSYNAPHVEEGERLMANPEHVAVVKRGAEGIREWLRKNPESLDLQGADLRGINLEYACLEIEIAGNMAFTHDLTEANLSGAVLNGATFDSVSLNGARLTGARALGTSFWAAGLKCVDFQEADLWAAEFVDARLGRRRFRRRGAWANSLGLPTFGLRESMVNDPPSAVHAQRIRVPKPLVQRHALRGNGRVPARLWLFSVENRAVSLARPNPNARADRGNQPTCL